MAPPRHRKKKVEFAEADVQALLAKELECLKRKAGFGWELKVSWLPSGSGRLEGEVKQDVICVYSDEPGRALQTLRHEFVDFCVSQMVEPYKLVTNTFIKMVNDDAYRRKEKVIQALISLIGEREEEPHKGG